MLCNLNTNVEVFCECILLLKKPKIWTKQTVYNSFKSELKKMAKFSTLLHHKYVCLLFKSVFGTFQVKNCQTRFQRCPIVLWIGRRVAGVTFHRRASTWRRRVRRLRRGIEERRRCRRKRFDELKIRQKVRFKLRSKKQLYVHFLT